jgi:hypothetical protein
MIVGAMFYAGLDLGQRQDHTALAVVERLEQARAYLTPVFDCLVVRHVERLPLGTPYPRVVERVRQVLANEELQGKCSLSVDATGVGAPVVDMLRGARLGCEVTAVSITGGEREHQSGSIWNVPKRDLIAGVQMLLEQGQLKIARRLRDTGSLVKELMDVRMTMKGNGRVRLGADGAGQHDDLVIALALALWRAKRRGIGFVGQRLPGM